MGGAGGWQQADEQLNFEWSRQKLLAGKEKENSQIFNEDFYLPLYLPLWCSVTAKMFKLQTSKDKSKFFFENYPRAYKDLI